MPICSTTIFSGPSLNVKLAAAVKRQLRAGRRAARGRARAGSLAPSPARRLQLSGMRRRRAGRRRRARRRPGRRSAPRSNSTRVSFAPSASSTKRVGVAGRRSRTRSSSSRPDLEALLREVDVEREVADLEPRARRVGQRDRRRRRRRLRRRDRELHAPRPARPVNENWSSPREPDERVEAVPRVHLDLDLDRPLLRARLLLERRPRRGGRTASRAALLVHEQELGQRCRASSRRAPGPR